jgi:hypothetical protein
MRRILMTFATLALMGGPMLAEFRQIDLTLFGMD